MSLNKRPVFHTKEESFWYERTPKRVIFAIMRDFAHQHVGIADGENLPHQVLAVIKDRQETIQCAGYDDAS